ncbi:MAG: 3-deoxy-D-manno-octulosonic acid transferase [Rhodobacteraceae bacterium]|nr:3-deoxy-D-manno-octulosonic acid transferase [Paracoccaceae bacterium]
MFFYRLLLTAISPVLIGMFLVRVFRGRESFGDLRERLGFGVRRQDKGPLIWLHGASNGELTAGRFLVEELLERDPELKLLVTCNTLSGRDLVRGWNMPRVQARLAPVDFRWSVRMLVCCWCPSALVVLENELWPNRIDLCPRLDCPVVIAGARMSERSARSWDRFHGLARYLLGRVRYLAPQDSGSGKRLLELGLPEAAMGPVLNLKPLVQMATPDPTELATLGQVFERSNTVLAGSTHDGEERAVLRAFALARKKRPDLRLILAPRHPQRSVDVTAEIRAAGLPCAIRSQGQAPRPDCSVYLADTLGEMPLWYALAGVTFVGGSLVQKGGHTPYEPAQFDSAILHGPDTANFASAYAALDAGGGSRKVAAPEDLARALIDLADPAWCEDMTAKAREALSREATSGPAVEACIAAIARAATRPALMPESAAVTAS